MPIASSLRLLPATRLATWLFAGLVISFGLLLMSVSPAAAQSTCTFNGAVDDDYNNSGNWSCAAAPTSTTNVIIPTTFDVSATSTASAGTLTLAAGATLTTVGATLNVSTGTSMIGGSILAGSSVTFNSVISSGTIRETGVGSVNFTGNVTNTGSILADSAGLTARFVGTFANAGGTFDSDFLLRFEGSGNQSISSNITVVYGLQISKTGGTVSLEDSLMTSNSSGGFTMIGDGPATFDLNGFTFEVLGNVFSIALNNQVVDGFILYDPTLGSGSLFYEDNNIIGANLILSPSATGTITLDGSPEGVLYIDADFQLTAGTTTFAGTDNRLVVLGTTTNDGIMLTTGALAFTTTTNNGTIGSGNVFNGIFFSGDLTNNGVLNPGPGDVTFEADWNTLGSFYSSGTVRFQLGQNQTVPAGWSAEDLLLVKSAGTVTLTGLGAVTTTDTVFLEGGTLVLNDHYLYTTGWLNTEGAESLDPTDGTVYFTSGNNTISAEPNFYIVYVDAGATTKTLTGDINIGSSLNLVSGFLAAGDNTITIERTGFTPFTGPTASFLAGSSTVIFTAETLLGGTVTTTNIDDFNYYNLTLQGTGITYSLTGSTTVMGPDTLTIAAGDTLAVGTSTLTVVGSIVNLGLITVNYAGGGQIIHPAESIAISDSAGTPVSTVNAGSRLYVTLEDSNRNLDGTVIETVTSTVSGDVAAGSDSETITLTETSASSGIFRNTIGVEVVGPSTAVVGNGRFEIAGNGILTATYTDDQDPSDVATDTASASTSPAGGVVTPPSGGGGGGGVTGPLTTSTTPGGGGPSLPLDLLPVPVHSLVKLPCVGFPGVNDPCKAVYYVGSDGRRHAFPHEKVYYTWYANFDGVQLVSEAQMSSMPLGANITYKPGVKMVKFMTLNRVYAVERGGVLRWVTTEAIASALYGPLWNTRIDDISDAFYGDYRFGADINSTADYSPAVAEASVRFPSDSLAP